MYVPTWIWLLKVVCQRKRSHLWCWGLIDPYWLKYDSLPNVENAQYRDSAHLKTSSLHFRPSKGHIYTFSAWHVKSSIIVWQQCNKWWLYKIFCHNFSTLEFLSDSCSVFFVVWNLCLDSVTKGHAVLLIAA